MNDLNIIVWCFIFAIFSCQSGKEKHSALSGGTNSIDSLLVEAKQFYNSNSYSKALKSFSEIIDIDTTIAEAYYSRAYCWAMEGEYVKSNKDYLKSISLGYKKEEAYFNLGCNYATIFKDSLALVYFKKAYALNPKNKEAEEQILILNGNLNLIKL